MKIGINLLALKIGKVGGLQTYIDNLLKGFSEDIGDKNEFILYVAKDNEKYYKKYGDKINFKIKTISINSNSKFLRILYDGFFMERLFFKHKLDLMFSPTYSKTFFKKNFLWVTVIHDFQPLYFPENFSFFKRIWLQFGWKNALKTSNVILISEFVKKDLKKKLNYKDDKNIKMIYNPIEKIQEVDEKKFPILEKKYKIEKNNYYYTVSSLAPHKNLETLLKMIVLKKEKKLVISGVGNKEVLKERINQMGIEDRIILTGYISDEERNLLYKNCEIFLFSSEFEGFGMPIIEALYLDKRVIVSDIEVLREITCNKVEYVKKFKDPESWMKQIDEGQKENENNFINKYDLKEITKQYLNYFEEVSKGS